MYAGDELEPDSVKMHINFKLSCLLEILYY